MGFSMMLFRRDVLTAAIGGAAAWVGLRGGFGAAGSAAARSGHDALAAFCARLGCPEALGTACLQALPAEETAAQHLPRVILAQMRSTGGYGGSTAALRDWLRAQSRHDFAHGQIVYVDGWMLSRTETRVYALSTLLAREDRQPIG